MNLVRTVVGGPLLVAAFLSPLASQDPRPLPGDIATAAMTIPAVAVDQPQPDGPWLFRGASYKATIGRDGWRFAPRPPSVDLLRPIDFRLTSFRVGGEAQALVAAAPVRDGNFVRLDHRSVIESLEARADGVEQTFVVPHLGQRGALQLVVQVDTQLRGEDVGEGVRFADEHHDVHYGEAIAIDADGRRCSAPTQFAAGAITIDVPDEFVATARLPLTIDPLVASQMVPFPGTQIETPLGRDVVWDEAYGCYVVVFEVEWTPGDSDVFAYYLTPELQYQLSVLVDVGPLAWTRPRMAYLRSGGQCMVVCQTRNAANTAWTIRGRAFIPGLLSSEVVVEDPAVPGHLPGDKWTPDICGDSRPNAPAFYTVVWESRDASGGDVHMKQVQSTMQLVTNAPLILANGSADQRAPSISKSYGGSTAQPHAVVVFESRAPSATQTDVHAAVVGPTGTILQAASAFDASAADDRRPVVSSPNLAAGEVLVVYESVVGGVVVDIGARIAALPAGVVTGRVSLAVLDTALPFVGLGTVAAEVDCDGFYFSVARQGVAADGTRDVRVSTWRRSPVSGLPDLMRGATVSGAGDEGGPAIASQYSSSGVLSRRLGLAWNGNVYAQQPWAGVYDSTGPISAQFFGNGCGAFPTISFQGSLQLGQTLTVTMAVASGLQGYVVGQPATLPIGGCPGCDLLVDGTVIGGTLFAVQVPLVPSLLGVRLSTQGFRIDAGGACLGAITLTPAIDAVVTW